MKNNTTEMTEDEQWVFVEIHEGDSLENTKWRFDKSFHKEGNILAFDEVAGDPENIKIFLSYCTTKWRHKGIDIE